MRSLVGPLRTGGDYHDRRSGYRARHLLIEEVFSNGRFSDCSGICDPSVQLYILGLGY